MEKFINKLVNESDEWITNNALKDKKVFKSALKQVIAELPPSFKNKLSKDIYNKIVNSLWSKIQQKYDQSSNIRKKHFFSKVDIDEYLKTNNKTNSKKALQSKNATLKHYYSIKSSINPLFKSFGHIQFEDVNDLLDIILKDDNKCNDEIFSLVQYRYSQLMSNKSVSTKQMRKLTLV